MELWKNIEEQKWNVGLEKEKRSGYKSGGKGGGSKAGSQVKMEKNYGDYSLCPLHVGIITLGQITKGR